MLRLHCSGRALKPWHVWAGQVEVSRVSGCLSYFSPSQLVAYLMLAPIYVVGTCGKEYHFFKALPYPSEGSLANVAWLSALTCSRPMHCHQLESCSRIRVPGMFACHPCLDSFRSNNLVLSFFKESDMILEASVHCAYLQAIGDVEQRTVPPTITFVHI